MSTDLEAAESIIATRLSSLAKRDDWAEDGNAIAGQAANIAQQLVDAGLVHGAS